MGCWNGIEGLGDNDLNLQTDKRKTKDMPKPVRSSDVFQRPSLSDSIVK